MAGYYPDEDSLPGTIQARNDTERWIYRQVFNQIYRRWRAYGRHTEAESFEEAESQALQALAINAAHPPTVKRPIPKIIHRVVPVKTDPQTEVWWELFGDIHYEWEMKTWRDPLNPEEFPITRHLWRKVQNGAQLADLVRLEVLLKYGGIYVDSDIEPVRHLEPFLETGAFAAWEDARVVPNAVMGASPGHPAIAAALDLMLVRVPGPTWWAGPGVTTALFPARDDVVCFEEETFYPVHYNDPERDRKFAEFKMDDHPNTFGIHWYAGSWLKKK